MILTTTFKIVYIRVLPIINGRDRGEIKGSLKIGEGLLDIDIRLIAFGRGYGTEDGLRLACEALLNHEYEVRCTYNMSQLKEMLKGFKLGAIEYDFAMLPDNWRNLMETSVARGWKPLNTFKTDYNYKLLTQ